MRNELKCVIKVNCFLLLFGANYLQYNMHNAYIYILNIYLIVNIFKMLMPLFVYFAFISLYLNNI